MSPSVPAVDRSTASLAFLALGAAAVAGWLLAPSGPTGAALLVALDLLVAVTVGLAVRRQQPGSRTPWLLLAGGQLCSVVAYVHWYLVPAITGVERGSPSASDWLFVVSYGMGCLAVAMLVRADGPHRNRRAFLDVLIVTSCLGVLSWMFLMAPYARAGGLTVEARLLSLAYPAVDLLLFVLVVRLFISGARPSPGKWLLLGWSGAQLLADTTYGIEVLGGRWTFDGPVSPLWMVSFTFLGAAALHPSIRCVSEPAVDEREQRRALRLRTGIVVVCASVLPLVLIAKLVQGDLAGLPVITAGSFAVFALALGRGGDRVRSGAGGRDRWGDRRSLARLVAGFVVLALLPLVLLGLTSVRLAERAVERDVLTRADTTASTSSLLVGRQLAGVGNLVSSYAERRLLVDAMSDGSGEEEQQAAVARHLEQLATANDDIRGAFLADRSGHLTAVAPHFDPLIGADLSHRDWYDGVIRGADVYVSSAYQTEFTGPDPVTAVVAPVRDTRGVVIAYLAALYDLRSVQDLSSELSNAHGMVLRITDQRGVVVAGPGSTAGPDAIALTDDRVAAALAGGSGVAIRGRGDDAVISAHEPVRELGWTVTTEVPRSTALASLDRLRPTVLGIATLLSQALLGGLVLLVRSLRQRRDAERTLQKSEERTTAILHATVDAFLSLDHRGVITAWNAKAEELFGWRADEACGRQLAAVVPLSDRLHQIRAGQRNEANTRHRDGTTFPVEFVMWTTGSGDDLVYSALVHDITERRRQDDEVATARDQALEASRLKSEFLAVVSHEIRTPMNGVLGMSSLLLSTDLDGEQREYAQTIRDSGENLLTLVNDVLDLSKAESGRLTLEVIDFSLHQVLDDVADLLGVTAAERGNALVTEVADDIPSALRGDPGRLRQVLTNLVGNAVKFTSAGSVTVTAHRLVGEGRPAQLRFEVTDTGIGIADDVIPLLFEAFSQADASTTRRFGGTGLGLAISRQLVELLGGEIGVSSVLGTGSTFWFTIPLVEAPPLREPVASVAVAVPPVTGQRSGLVLVAEDNPVNQRIAVRMLEKLGHRADLAVDGHEAVEAMRRIPYDLVLMDCQMPGMDGYGATAAIRAMPAGQPDSRRVPIIAMTASTLDADRKRCLEAGMNDFLSKPVRLHDLAAAVQAWLPSSGGRTLPVDPPGPGADGATVVDATIVENLRAMGDGFLDRVVAMFVDGVPERFAGIRAAVDAADAPALTALAHGLRGTSASLGGTVVADTCAAMEDAAVRGDVGAAAALVPDLERQLAALAAALGAYVVEPVR